MDDAQFIEGIRRRIEETTGERVELALDQASRNRVSVEFAGDAARVVMGTDVLVYPGLARVLTQYAILCVRERRSVGQGEFLLFLRRN